MQMRKPAVIDEVERTGEHLFGLRRETGDNIATENDIRTQPPHLLAEFDCIFPRMPALHPLQDEVVAGLQRQM